MPLAHRLIHPSCPASGSPRAPGTEVADAEPEAVVQWGSRGQRAAPAGQPQVTERTGAGERDLGADVGNLVEQGGKADLRLGDAEFAQIEVDHRLAELRQPGPGRLDAVAVGDVEEVDARHGLPFVSSVRPT